MASWAPGHTRGRIVLRVVDQRDAHHPHTQRTHRTQRTQYDGQGLVVGGRWAVVWLTLVRRVMYIWQRTSVHCRWAPVLLQGLAATTPTLRQENTPGLECLMSSVQHQLLKQDPPPPPPQH